MSAVGRADAATGGSDRSAWMLGIGLAVFAFIVYWLSNWAHTTSSTGTGALVPGRAHLRLLTNYP